METYYETIHDDGGEFPVTTAHETLEAAIKFAETNGVTLISEAGGAFDEYQKCEWCGEWMPAQDLNEAGLCERCTWYTTKGRC